MDDLQKILYNALSNYFNYVESTGYIKENNLLLLLLLDFINNFLKDEDLYNLTVPFELDLIHIQEIISCLISSSCFINWDGCGINIYKNTCFNIENNNTDNDQSDDTTNPEDDIDPD